MQMLMFRWLGQRVRRSPGPIASWVVIALVASALAPGCGSDKNGHSSGIDSAGAAGEAGALSAGGEAGEMGGGTGGTIAVPAPACGDGRRDDGEACDDGNLDDGDGCDALCSLEGPACGNGEREGTEQCDDGNLDDGDGCDSLCQDELSASACGDGVADPGEGCDDANLLPGDGCDADCQSERCGNDRVDAGEECDPPVTNHCSDSCLRLSPNCGDGDLQEDEFEECDDGNDEPSDGCHECRITCGNGRVEGAFGEACEQQYSPATCSESCQWLPVCGDGLVDPDAGEECDPSNGVTCVECKTRTPDPPNCDEGGGGDAGAGPNDEDCPPPECLALGEPGQLVTNGTFDADATSWLPHSGFVTLTPTSDGVPEPYGLDIAFSPTETRSVSGAYQCIPIRPGAEYELTGEYLIPNDSPDEITASVTVLLYNGTVCEGDWVRPPGNGPNGRERGTWTPYQWLIDTSTLLGQGEATEGRMLLRLNVSQPAGATGTHVVWDNVSVTEIGSLCGDCVVDDGEGCDDGNQTAGDGCSPLCQAESCGNELVEGGEACDDGDTEFSAGDECSPACQLTNACDACSLGVCNSDPSLVDDCWNLTGQAEEGPAAGTARSVLCERLRSCVRDSACHQVARTTEGVEGAFIENCYCGVAGEACLDSSGAANGSCKDEIEAALETEDPIEVFQRMSGGDPEFEIFSNVDRLITCEQAACADCVVPSVCGDGHVQDRNYDYVFSIGHDEIPCRDDLTFTKRGCSFEECDDGNLAPGDGCDEHCFVEKCGNNVTQAGEDCDDGNQTDNDACSNECHFNYVCGDGYADPLGEECDPPNEGPLCSLEEYAADAAACGCDELCSYAVCGNGITQRPREQCDPPDGVICDDNCQFVGGGPCDDCIAQLPYTGEFSETFCDSDPLCFAMKRCALEPIGENGPCYSPIAAECLCGEGADLKACEEDPLFELTGHCVEQFKAGLVSPYIDLNSNASILQNLYAYGTPAGNAMLIVEEARVYCADVCGL